MDAGARDGFASLDAKGVGGCGSAPCAHLPRCCKVAVQARARVAHSAAMYFHTIPQNAARICLAQQRSNTAVNLFKWAGMCDPATATVLASAS